VTANGIGDKLRDERLRQGLTLEDILQRTRISLRSLEAIEADAFDRLPGAVFARSFVRKYALALGLDSEPLLAAIPQFDVNTAPLPRPPVASRRAKWDPRMTAAVASAVWIVTAAGAVTGAWYYFNHHGLHFATTVVSAHAAKPVPAQQQPVLPVQQPVSGASEQSVVSLEQPQAQATDPAAPPANVDNSHPLQVIITAHDVVWVQVSADGKRAFVGTLHANDTRTVAADAQVKILTGNAGALDVSLNGKPIGPIGPKLQVRTVRLTAEGPQFSPQNPPAFSPL